MCVLSSINLQQSYCVQRRDAPATLLARLGLSWEGAAHLANQHTMRVQRWLSSRAPGAACFEGAGVTAASTGIPVPLLNLALDAQFPATCNAAAIAQEIADVKGFFVARDVPFTWWLSPLATPEDIDRRLRRHGLAPRDYRLPAMIAPLDAPERWPLGHPNVQVWSARDREDLEAASLIRRVAFRFPEGVALTYFEDMAEDWLRGDPARLYLARVGDAGPPVAMGALVMGDGVPGVYVLATLPDMERQGLGKAILHRILTDAAAEGHRLIVLTSGAKAYSLYRKFGFMHIFEYGLYQLSQVSER